MKEDHLSVQSLSADAVEIYLQEINEICADTHIIDCHVHATEVIRDAHTYQRNEGGLISTEDAPEYKPPAIAGVRLDSGNVALSAEKLNRLSEMAFTRTYKQTGPRVLIDQMDLARVDRAVLLPVAHSEESLRQQMLVIDQTCRSSVRFIPGYSVPNSIMNAEIGAYLRDGVMRSNIQVVKVHGNVCGIDFASDHGVDRLNAILQACSDLELPLLVHGGCSPILGACPESKYSRIENLAAVDWSASKSPVIIAHFGVYGCGEGNGSFPTDLMRVVNKLLEKHENIFLDTSGVGFPAIFGFLKHVESDRLVFGSDAMYVPMYRQIVYVMHALKQLGEDTSVIRAILSANSMRVFGLSGRA